MQEFDPRKFSTRQEPRVAIALAVATVAGLIGWQTALRLDGAASPALAPAQAAALQHAAFARAEAQPGYGRAENVSVSVRPGETLERAVQRAGVSAEDAQLMVGTLSRAMDTVRIKAGLTFDAAVAQPRAGDGEAKLVGLSLRTGPATAVTVSRTFDGALRLRALEEKVVEQTTVAHGEIQGSLYQSAQRLGATPAITAQVAKLFAHKLDFQRDIQPGDDFRLVFDRKVTESGRTIETGDLTYAELHGVKFFASSATTARSTTSTSMARTSGVSSCAHRSTAPASPRASASAGIRSWAMHGRTRASTSAPATAPRSWPPVTAWW